MTTIPHLPKHDTVTVDEPTPSPKTDTGPPAERSRSGSFRSALAGRGVQSSLTLVAFLLLFVGYGFWLGAPFLNVDARLLDVHQNTPILLLALAALVTLIPGMFDLSIASMATLTTFLTIGLRTQDGLSFPFVLLICIAVGFVGGLLNGILVERLHVNTFIATLGTGGMFLGISAVYSDGAQIAPLPDGVQLPKWFLDAGLFTQKTPVWLTTLAALGVAAGLVAALGRFRPTRLTERTWLATRIGAVVVIAAATVLVFNLPKWLRATSVLVAVLFAVTFVLWLLIQQTSYGRYLRAVGSNRGASQLAGVPVRSTVMRAFVLGGLLAALSGVVLGSTQSVAVPNVATSYLLPAFAAAFLSTVVLSAGQFTVFGTLIGGVFLIWVSQGLILGGLAPTWTDIVNGAVLVVAVAISSVLRRKRA